MNLLVSDIPSYEIWKGVLERYDPDKADALIGEYIAVCLKNSESAKAEVYELTLEWVNAIRATRMKNQPKLDSLMPGREFNSDACTIAKSLDTLYKTSVGGSLLAEEHIQDAPYSDGLQWYAEWVNVEDPEDHGYAELPWFAYILAKGFDYGAFPELTRRHSV